MEITNLIEKWEKTVLLRSATHKRSAAIALELLQFRQMDNIDQNDANCPYRSNNAISILAPIVIVKIFGKQDDTLHACIIFDNMPQMISNIYNKINKTKEWSVINKDTDLLSVEESLNEFANKHHVHIHG